MCQRVNRVYMGRIITAKVQCIFYYIITVSYSHSLHGDKMRSLKIRWCKSAALCLSPVALRMWSCSMLSFYLGITMA